MNAKLSKTVFSDFLGKNGSCFIVDSEATIQSKYLIFESIQLTITGFKMMPKLNLCGSSILGYSRLKMMKTMRASKKPVKPMLFCYNTAFSTLLLLCT